MKRAETETGASRPDETVTSRNASDRIEHDFGALTAEEGANEDGRFMYVEYG